VIGFAEIRSIVTWLKTQQKGQTTMKTTTKTVAELLKTKDSPLPLEVIPNNMGINLCSVEAITWTRQDNDQLVSLTIHFLPNK